MFIFVPRIRFLIRKSYYNIISRNWLAFKLLFAQMTNYLFELVITFYTS